MDEQYKGALVDKHGAWTLTRDVAKLLAAPMNQAILVGSMEELKAALEAIYQHPSGLSVVQAGCPACRVYPHPYVEYTAREEEILAAAKLAGTIVTAYSPHNKTKIMESCVSVCDNKLGMYRITYDPKRAAARKNRAAKAVSVRGWQVLETARSISKELHSSIRLRVHYDRGTTRADSATDLMRVLALFDVLYGKLAHRRLECWQGFVAKWGESQKASTRTWTSIHQSFTAMMNKEVRAKKRRLFTAKQLSKYGPTKTAIGGIRVGCS